jgi:hypothetical protein
MQTNKWGLWIIVGVAGLASSASLYAQDDGALGGPKVNDKSVRGERRTLTGKGDPKIDRPARAQARLFERAVGSLRADDAPAELKLTDDQDAKIGAIREEFLAQLRSYADEHRAEFGQLRDQLPPRERGRVDQFLSSPRGPGGPDAERGPRGKAGDTPGGKGKGGPGGPPPPPDDAMQGDEPMRDAGEVEAAKARLKELMDGAPKPVDAHARMMAVLTDAQRDAVNKELESLQKEAADRGPRGEGRGEGREQLRDELMQHLTAEEKEKLKAMSPEERREFIRSKASERRKEGGKGGK